ncbi:putative sugar ABC transporter integral membrane protein [Streptomyces himastatinicus ATCC 53653]|uniref:Putative sugar ABC transporter integral membrane protein n=1 Tax=Streptomyces himastatinicus ATCC 53653 TaxID=457427 RepID=D9WGM9_9ACTN|nr:ABC transporter permease [Streptomyces himastatinicus]EFL25417.1 putative sugar ABC transporter integral membrane protein [Streptomyces himastatinicus ATCC 53653]
MSATATATKSTAPGKAPKRGPRMSVATVLLIIAGTLVALSVLRALAGGGQQSAFENITSSGQIGAALSMAVPIGLAGLGGLWAERAGVVNIGLEGMMILGTFFGAWAGYQTNPWVGVLAGVLGGAVGGLVHAIATVTFGVDHIISGVAINILALGATTYLAKRWFEPLSDIGGSPKQSPQVDDIASFTVPGLSDGLATVENHHWFLVSDLAGLLGGLVTDISALTIVSILLFAGTFFVLWKTSFGLRLRSCGENPTAAESLGVNVYLYKYAAVVISGGLAGLGGVFLALVRSHIYNEGQTGGRGYIGLAAMLFGNWRPGGLAMGAGLFGYSDALQLRNGGATVHALLLLVALGLALLAGWRLYRKRYVAGAVCGGAALVLVLWYALTDTVANDLVPATPYIVTLLVMGLAAQRLRMPKANNKPYRKGQGT